MWGILKVVGGLELCQPLLDPRLEFTLVSIVDDVDQPVRALVLPDGQNALVIDCEIPDDAPPAVKEGLTRRALVNGGQDCPCGAPYPRPNRAQRRKLETVDYLHIEVVHEVGCPAETELLVALVREWVASR